jgi:Flp pilus assembly protein TadB
MELHNLVALWLVASLLGGLAVHAAIAAWSRRSYDRLHAACAGAVADAQETNTPDALVRAEELHRQFMRATRPSWLSGLGAHLKAAPVICGLVGLALMIGTGRLPPVLAGLVLLFAIGLRRILLAAVLLLAVFVATSLTHGPPDRPIPMPVPATKHAPPSRLPAPSGVR